MSETLRIAKAFRKLRRKNPLPRPANYGGKYFGDVVDEIFIPMTKGKEYGDHVAVVQLIERKGKDRKPQEWFRFGHYRMKSGGEGFVWAARNGLTIEVSDWKRLKEIAEKQGFW